jgi:hypothetical protein
MLEAHFGGGIALFYLGDFLTSVNIASRAELPVQQFPSQTLFLGKIRA